MGCVAAPAREPDRPTAIWWLCLASIVWVAALLRLYGIERQILVDDEWHAVHEILHHGYLELLLDDGWTASGDHYSVPYAVLFKLLADGVGLSELAMRAPALIAGITLVPLLPIALRRAVGGSAALILAALLAISPLLVFFSRVARPYAVSLELSIIAILSLYAWLSNGRRWVLVVAAVCALLAALLHASTIPLFCAGIGCALVFGGGVRRWRATLAEGLRRRSLRVAALLVLALAIVALPYAASPVSLQRVLFHDVPSRQTVRIAFELWLGTTHTWLLLALLALAATGMLTIVAERRRLLAYLVSVAVVGVAGMLLLSPRGFKFGVVLARFCLFVLPVLLVLIAVGVDRVSRLVSVRPAVAVPAAVAGWASLYLLGPLPSINFYPNAFANHGSWQADYRTERYFDLFAPRCIPPLYLALAQLPPATLRIVEAPWYYYWHSFAFYQRLHRQRVTIGFVDEKTDQVRIGEVPRDREQYAFRNMVHVAEEDGLRRLGIDLVVFHRDVQGEMRIPFADVPVPVDHWLAEYDRRFGPAIYQDRDVVAYFVGEDAQHRTRLHDVLTAPSRVRPALAAPVCDG